jgi:heme/copper-type cytochrome/quinol oxidase subunit 2
MCLFYRASLLHDIANWRRVSTQDAIDADNMVAGAVSGQIFVNLVVLILLIIWAWRATKNLQAWDAPLKWRPGWAIAGWFIPIGMLWIPYQVVRDAWRLAPMSEKGPANQQNGTWLFGFLTWWGSIVLLRIGGLGEAPDAMRNTQVIAGFGALLGCASAIAIFVAIGQISRRQDQAHTA